MNSHLSTLKLHQLRYGELDADAAAAARTHLEACDLCRGRLQAQEAVRNEVVARPVPEALRSRPVASRWRGWFALLGGGALVAATALLGARMAWYEEAADPVDVEITRTKGELPAVEVWVADGDGAHLLGEGERLGEGDAIQLQLDPRGARFVTIAGADGSGDVEIYDTWAPTEPGLQPAPFALTLDDAPGPQDFWVIGTHEVPPESAIRAIVAGSQNIPDVRASKVTIEKE